MKSINYAVLAAAGLFSISAAANVIYIPSLANFSVLYNFVPIEGKVKTLKSHFLFDPNNGGYDVNISLSPAGCIESFAISGYYPAGEIALSRKGNTLSGTANGRPLSYEFDKKCNLISATDDRGVTHYTLNTEGLVVSATLKGEPLSTHKYKENGRLIRSEYYQHGKVVKSTDISHPVENERPSDSESQSTLANGQTSAGWIACVYDEKMFPWRCSGDDLTIENGVRKHDGFIADTQVEYY